METRFSLIFEGGSRDGESIPLRAPGLKIGRKPGNDLVLDDANASGAHAEIVFEGDRVLLRDLGSTNGTILDGRKIEEVILSHGDKITIGHTFFRFDDAQAPAVEAAEPHRLKLDRAGAGKRGALIPAILLIALAGAGGFYFFAANDGVEGGGAPLKEVPGNLLRSASFESGENESSASFWNLQDGSSESFSIVTTKRSGRHAAGVSFDGAEAAGKKLARLAAAQPVSMEPGQRFRLAGWVKQSGAAAAALGVRFSSSSDPQCQVEERSAWQNAEGSGFTRVELEIDAPPGADRAAIFALACGSEGKVIWDDLELVKSGAAAALPKAREFAYKFGAQDGFIHKIDAYLARGFRNETGDPASALVAAVETTNHGFSVRYTANDGGKTTLRFVVTPVALGEAGVMTLRGLQSAVYANDFQEEKVEGIVFGGEANAMRIAFAAPSLVRGRSAGSEGFVIEIPWEKELLLSFQVSFEEEKKRASELLLEAQKKEEEKAWGGALAFYGAILNQFPFDKRSVEKARARYDSLLREGQQKISALEKSEEEARFFGLRDGFLQAKRQAELLAKSYDGSEIAIRARTTMTKIESGLKELQILLDREESKRLKGLAAGLEAAKQRKLAEELRSYLRAHYTESGDNP